MSIPDAMPRKNTPKTSNFPFRARAIIGPPRAQLVAPEVPVRPGRHLHRRKDLHQVFARLQAVFQPSRTEEQRAQKSQQGQTRETTQARSQTPSGLILG